MKLKELIKDLKQPDVRVFTKSEAEKNGLNARPLVYLCINDQGNLMDSDEHGTSVAEQQEALASFGNDEVVSAEYIPFQNDIGYGGWYEIIINNTPDTKNYTDELIADYDTAEYDPDNDAVAQLIKDLF
jgi:hypothetical protein